MAVKIYTGFFLLAIVLLYFAYRQYQNTTDLLLMGKKAKATVINLIKSRSDDGYVYKPVFEYKTANGERKTYTSSIGSSPPAYRVGEQVQVVYDKMNDVVKIVSFWGLYRWTIILLMIASPILVLTTAYLFYTKSLV